MGSPRGLLIPFLAVFGLIATDLKAQVADPVPLKNWPAPLTWQATTPSEQAAAREKEAAENKLTPQMTMPGNSTQLGVLVALTPCRLVDTRSNMPYPYGSGSSSALTWPAGGQYTIPAPGLTGGPYYYGSGTGSPVTNSCNGLPAAIAYSANITVIPQPTLRWLSVCPTGTPVASCSAIAALTDYQNAAVLSNAVVIPATAAGSFDVYCKDATQVIIDINGYYTSPSALALGAGTQASPSLTFSNDATTGLYSPSAGVLRMTSAGTDVMSLAGSGITVNGNIYATGYPLSSPTGWAINAPTAYFSTSGTSYNAFTGRSVGTGNTTGVVGEVNSTTGIAGKFMNDATTGKAVSAVVDGTEVMNVTDTGVHAGPGMTGTPWGYATYNDAGTLLNGSGNITCTWNAAWFQPAWACLLAGTAAGDTTKFTAIASAVSTDWNSRVTTYINPYSTGSATGMAVEFLDTTGTGKQLGFSLVVFKP